MTLSAGMQTAMDQPAGFGFNAFEFVLPSGTVRLLDGASEVTFTIPEAGTGTPVSATFVGSDDTYGTVGRMEALEEGVNSEAPRVRVVVNPRDTAAHALWTAPEAQFGLIRVWSGAIDLSVGTGAVVSSPQLEFQGIYDRPRTMMEGGRSVEIDVASEWELMFAADQGQRLSPEFHKTVWYGELGFDYVTGVQRQLYWGSKQAGVLNGQRAWSAGSTWDWSPAPFTGGYTGQVLGISRG